MKIDITLRITPKMVTDAQGNEKKTLVGHLGTHFDVMNKEFPLEYTERKGIIFDVSRVKNRDIDIVDIDMDKLRSQIGAIKGIGETRLNQIMEIIAVNLKINSSEGEYL